VISLRSGRLHADDGGTTFVDRDWLGPGGDGPIPALQAASAEAAAAQLLAGGDHIVSLLETAPAGRAEVIGDGLTAISIRSALAGRGAASAPPAALVDCTGDPVRLLELIPGLRDQGVIVLAGEPQGRELALDLYIDVHRRGLRIVGAPRPEAHAPVTDEARIRHALEQLERVRAGESPPAAPWFAVESR
jgi:threonine dehydrogenase-like Zn-dependent dehydrogenase